MDSICAQAIKEIGGPAKVARLFEPPITIQAVVKWKRVPHQRARVIARASGIPVEVLRPDVFGEPPAAQPQEAAHG